MRVARNGVTPGKPSGINGRLAAQMAVNGQENMPIPLSKPHKSTKLLITNLDNDITDSDICELFSEFGSVREVAVHYNCWGYSLGTAHVVYLQPEDAAEAARRYNGVPLDDRPMTITLEGSTNVPAPLPVKMRLSFGPNAFRNPLSQLNNGGKTPKTPKRLASGPKPFNLKNNGDVSGLGVARGRGKPRGRPAVVRGRPVGRLPTAAELDLELEEYLSQTKKNTKGVVDEVPADDFGHVNDELMEITKTPKNTPGRSGKTKKTPGKTPKRTPGKTKKTPGKTPSRTPGKTPSRTPGKTPKRTPGKTPKRTPGKTPKRTPGKTPSRTPGKSPSRTSGKTPSMTAEETPSMTAEETPSMTAEETPSMTAEETPSMTAEETPSMTVEETPSMTVEETPSMTVEETPLMTPAKTPSRKTTARTPGRTPARTPGRVPAKTPGKTPGKSAKQTKAPSTTTDETEVMEVTDDLEKNNPPSAVPKAVKKLNPRRSGRFPKME